MFPGGKLKRTQREEPIVNPHSSNETFSISNHGYLYSAEEQDSEKDSQSKKGTRKALLPRSIDRGLESFTKPSPKRGL